MFKYILYKQKDGVAMESLLGPTMANVFLFYKFKLLEQYPNEFKPFFLQKICWWQFLLFESAEHFSKVHADLDIFHPSMTFSSEQERKGKLSFLEREVSQQQGKFVTTV